MKKSIVLFLVLIIAAMSALSVCNAAPLNRYYDQGGGKYWCNVDNDGCWVTGEGGGHEYIMFWSEASRDKIMGPGSNAPIAERYNGSEMPLQAPPVIAAAGGNGGSDSRTEEEKCADNGGIWYPPMDNVKGLCGDQTCAANNMSDCNSKPGCTWLMPCYEDTDWETGKTSWVCEEERAFCKAVGNTCNYYLSPSPDYYTEYKSRCEEIGCFWNESTNKCAYPQN